MAVRLGYDRELLAAVSGCLARAVLQDIRRAVKREHGLASAAALHGSMAALENAQVKRQLAGAKELLAGPQRA